MTAPIRGRARRRWLLVAFGVLSIIAGLIAALPWLLQTPAVQRRMAAYANKIMAPGSVEFGAIRLSWFRPTEITRFVLHDARGDRLVSTPLATFGWNLWQILVTRPETVNLVIQQGDLDIERCRMARSTFMRHYGPSSRRIRRSGSRSSLKTAACVP